MAYDADNGGGINAGGINEAVNAYEAEITLAIDADVANTAYEEDKVNNPPNGTSPIGLTTTSTIGVC